MLKTVFNKTNLPQYFKKRMISFEREGRENGGVREKQKRIKMEVVWLEENTK